MRLLTDLRSGLVYERKRCRIGGSLFFFPTVCVIVNLLMRLAKKKQQNMICLHYFHPRVQILSYAQIDLG